MTTLSERATEEFIAAGAFTPGLPGFVGIAVDLVLGPAGAPAGRRPLRHGFLDVPSSRVMVVSGPPSPGLEVALRRMTDDLAAAGRIAEQHQATGSAHNGQVSPLGAGIRVGLEAGLETEPGADPATNPTDDGPLGLRRRWMLAHTLAPVLAAAFANAPLRHGRPSGWRSLRQARRRDLAVVPHTEAHHPRTGPRAGWVAYAMDDLTASGRSLRDRIRGGARPTPAELRRHLALLRPPVAARGHLELDVADQQPGDGWRVPAAVIATLLDDPRASDQAWAATAALAGEDRLWERAARDAMTDPVLAAAARECFLAAYAGLARLGAARELRDAVAEFTERYVHRGRCPADDLLDGARISG